MTVKIPEYEPKQSIRTLDFPGFEAGGDSSFPFMSENSNKTKSFFALEIPYIIENGYPAALKNYWGKDIDNFIKKVELADKMECDAISLKFNIPESELEERLETILSEVVQIVKKVKKPLILRGANNRNTDKILLSALSNSVKKQCIIAFADEITYETIAAATAISPHVLVLRSPIDINLAKELNILAIDNAMPADRLLIDPDMGGLGYGLDYGFSIVEKMKQAGFDGDKMLNMPIIVFAGEEAFKSKEAKSNNFDENWGDYASRALFWEIATAAAMICAGANIVVLWHPESIKVIKGLI